MFSIGSFEVSHTSKPFVIAEAGVNHNGELAKAFEMICVAKECGADAIKFQTFKANEFVQDTTLTYTYKSQGKEVTEPMIDMFKRYEFSAAQWGQIKDKCVEQNIVFLSTPQNYTDLELLLGLGIDAVKIGSDDFNNIPLIRSYSACGKPLIMSCGMADLAEIHNSLTAAGYYEGRSLVLLLCISEYPAPVESINLARLSSLKSTFPQLIVGFSDHSEGHLAATMSVALGARVIEKHFTLDKGLPGPDHWFSEDPASLKEYINLIRQASIVMGNSALIPSSAEYEMRKLARRSVFTNCAVLAGQVLTYDDLTLKRPGTGLPPQMLDVVVGKISARDLRKGELLKYGDFI